MTDEQTAPAAPESAPAVAQEPVAVPADPTVQVVPAEVQAVPDPSATPSTSPEPAAPTSGSATPVAKPVVVNQFTSRGDNDALLGSWVDVVSGDYAGRRGAYVDDDSHDPQTGYPDQILVRTRDAENELIVVNYSDVRPSAYTGGR